MKKILALSTIAIALLAGANLHAGDAPKTDPKPADKKMHMCCMVMEKCTLFTPDQKAKATALHAECEKAGCTEAAQKTFFTSLKALLTPEQIKECHANCEKAGIKNCPICGNGTEKTKKS